MFFQELPSYADWLTPRENFTMTPEEGKYYYPEKISFKKGKKYITLGQTEDSYIIRYEICEGIFERVHVPKNRMEYLKAPKKEALEKKRREAIKKREVLKKKPRKTIGEFEKKQRAKGLVKVGSFWVTKANAELWSEFVKLKQLRTEIIKLEQYNKKAEAELIKYHKYITKLNDSVVSLQQQLNCLDGWFETRGRRITKWSPQYEIEKHNSKVAEYTMLKSKISKTRLKQEKAQMYCEQKGKTLTYNNKECQAKKLKYIRKFSQFEPFLMNRLSNAQNNQKKFLNFIAENIRLLRKELKFKDKNKIVLEILEFETVE